MDIAKTLIKGNHAVRGERGLMAGMVCKMAITRKKMLASLRNCWIKASGLGIKYLEESRTRCIWWF